MTRKRILYRNLFDETGAVVTASDEDATYKWWAAYDRGIDMPGKFGSLVTPRLTVNQAALSSRLSPNLCIVEGHNWAGMRVTIRYSQDDLWGDTGDWSEVESETGGATCAVTRNASGQRSGNYCLQTSITYGASGAPYSSADSEFIAVDSAKAYTFSVWSKKASGSTVRVQPNIRCYDANKAVLGRIYPVVTADATADYAQTSMQAGSAGTAFLANTAFVKVTCFQAATSAAQNGAAWWDDLLFYETALGASANLLINPGFEDQIAARWTQAGSAIIVQSVSAPSVLANRYRYEFDNGAGGNPASIPECTEIFLGPAYELERNPSYGNLMRGQKDGVTRKDLNGGGVVYYDNWSGRQKKYRKWPLPSTPSAMATNVKALDAAWAGRKPYFIEDDDGSWFFAEQINRLDETARLANSSVFSLEVLEVLP